MTKLPQVGVEAVLLGAKDFDKNYQLVIDRIQGLNNASTQLASQSSQLWPALSNAAISSTALIVAGTTAAVGAIIGLGTAIVSAGAEFSQGLANVASISNATTEELQQLGDVAYDMATKVDIGMTQSAEAAGHLIRAGLEMQDVMEGSLQAVTNFAAASAGELSLEKASVLVAGALVTYNMTGAEAERVTNALTAAAVRSSVTFNDVYRSFQQVASISSSLGFDINETSAAIGVLGRNFMRGSDAGTSLKQMFIALMKPSQQALDTMKQYGITLYDSEGRIKSLRDIIAELEKAFGQEAVANKKVTEAERATALARIFGSDAIRSAISLATQGTKAYDEMVQATYSMNTAQIAAERVNSLSAQFTILINTLRGAITIMGTMVEPVFRKVVKQVNFLLDALNPEKLRVFGAALAALFTGTGFDKLYEDINRIFGSDLVSQVKPWIDAFLNVRNAIINQLIPSILYLFNSFASLANSFGGIQANLTGFINGLASAIGTVSRIIGLLGTFIQSLKQSEVAMALINIAIKGLQALPFVTMSIVIVGLGKVLIGLLGPIGLISLAIGALITVFDYVYNNWNSVITTIIGLIQGNLVPSIILIGTVATVASVIIVTKLVSAFNAAIKSVNGFINTIKIAMVPIAFFIERLQVATLAIYKFASSLVTTAVRALVTFSQAIFKAISSLGLLIISLAKTVGQLILTGVQSVVASGRMLLMASAAAVSAISIRNIDLALRSVVSSIIMVIDASIQLAKSLYTAAISAINTTVAFVKMAAAFVVSAVQAIPKLLTSIPVLIAQLYRLIAAQVLLAATTIRTWITTMVPVVLGAIGTVLAAIGPFLVGIAAIGAVISGVYLAWTNNWGNIRGVTDSAIKFVAGIIEKFFNWLRSIPGIGEFVNGALRAFNDFKEGAETTFNNVQSGIAPTIENAKTTVIGLGNTVQSEFLKMMGITDLGVNSMNDDLNRWIAKMEEARLQESLMAEVQTDFFAQGHGKIYGDFKEGGGGFSFPPDTTKDTESAADALKRITAEVKKLLADFPILTDEAAEFIAKLDQETPGRLGGMVSALQQSRGVIEDMIIAQRQLLATTLQIEAANRRISAIQLQIEAINLQQQSVELSYQAKLLGYREQILRIDQQIAPLRQRLVAIESQIARLQRDNLDLANQKLQLELSLLPLQKQSEDIDKAIQRLHREDYGQIKARAEAELDYLGIKYQIEDIEKSINDIVDRRLELEQREKLDTAKLEKIGLDKQLRKVTKDLDAAWASMNIDEIIRLEALKEQLEASLTPVEDKIKDIEDEQEVTRIKDDLTKIGLEREKLLLEEVLAPIQAKITLLEREKEIQNAKNAIVEAGLQKEKQAIADQMEPIQAKIDAITRTQEAQRIQNEIAINNLTKEKQAIEDLIEPLEAEKTRINDIINTIQLQMDREALHFAQQKLQWQERLNQEEILKNQLEQTRLKQEDVWLELVAQYLDIITKSKAFTTEEATEVLKRLGLWDDQVGKLQEVVLKFDAITKAAQNTKKAIDEIPRDITISVKYNTAAMPTMAKGGTVPGPLGKPMLIIAHGGEKFLGVGRSPAQTAKAETSSNGNTTIYQDNRIEVNANYTRTQEPVTLAMDLRSIVGMTRR